MMAQMIAVGEETGALDEMLDKIADFYEHEVEATGDQLTSLIEPLLIAVMGGTVGATAAGTTTTAAGAGGAGWRVHHSASAASSKLRPKPEASAPTGQALRAAAVAVRAG